MKHDADVGCNGKEGFMSGTAGMWSTCSRKAFLDHYNSMKSAGKWCLAGNSYLFFKDPSIIILTHLIVSHVAKSDACSQGLTMLTGHIDVGGSCPKNTYQYREIHCCCGDQSYEDGRSSEKSDETSGAQCCWNKCTWDVPPENCLKEVPNSQWVYHARFGYYIAMQNWKGDSIVGIHNNTFPCPENTKPYGDTCCCFHGCCWNKCVADNPPKECLPNIPGLEPVLEWAKNETKGYYTALQNWKGDLSEIKGFSEKESYEDGKNSSEKSDETSGSKETKKNHEDGKSSEESDETSETKKSYEDGKSSAESDETSEIKKSYEDGKSSEESDETSETKKSYEDGKSSLKSDETSETSDDDRSSSKDVDKSDESSEEKGHL